MKKILQILLPLVAFGILVFVWLVALSNNGGWAGTFNVDRNTLVYNLIRLAGLTAFTTLSFQVISGAFMDLFKKLYGWQFVIFHGYAGMFVILFALTHFGLIHLYMSFYGYTIATFSALYPEPYITFGPAALAILGLTGITAVLAVFILKQKQKKWWKYIHYANYLVFVLVFFHSIHIGTDVAGDNRLKILWHIFVLLFISGLIYKYVSKRQIEKDPTVHTVYNEVESANQ